jgi:hypothetical protein
MIMQLSREYMLAEGALRRIKNYGGIRPRRLRIEQLQE